MSKTVGGRKPLPAKPTFNVMSDDIFGNKLAVPAGVQKELASKGLEGRWVSYKQMIDNRGYHEKGWVVYKQEKSDTMDPGTFLGGADPDGYIRRGDAILAVRTVAKSDQHREWLKQRANRLKGHHQTAAEELRATARGAGLNSNVDDRFDEDEE